MMFSQLCRVKPRAVWNKVGLAQNSPETNSVSRSNHIESAGEDRCQLEQCTFCEFRVCCQVNTNTWEPECLQTTDPASQVTDNPAYGLSSKNWLETKEEADDDGNLSEIVSMEQLENVKCDKLNESLITNIPPDISASQENKTCDVNTIPKMNQVNPQSYFQQSNMELKTKYVEETSDSPKHDLHGSDLKLGKLTWSVLRHRQHSGDILKHCDKSSNVIEHSTNDRNQQIDTQEKSNDSLSMPKTKKNIKDRSFPLSLMRPIAKISDIKPETLTHHLNQVFKNDLLRQRPVQRNVKENYPNPRMNKEADSVKKLSSDILGLNSNPLSDIAQIKTEESVQEWLARIGESTNNTWPDESEEKDSNVVPPRSPWTLANSTNEENKGSLKLKTHNFHTDRSDVLLRKNTHNSTAISQTKEKHSNDDLKPKTESDTTNVLCSASKASPAHVPMVVMQCSRLHSHIGGKPPFQQTSLPMGTLVTALYQESDWLYVQTPHGVEGFVLSSNCSPIGMINEPAHTSRRPWEPCDFPIPFSIQKKHEFGRQQGSYIPAKLPTNSNGKQAAPYVNTVKMKTNFYSDRNFSYTFKSKDSIKTAKTVTDILRSSPETKVSNQ